MGLTLYEMETVISYNRQDDCMTVYSADPVVLRRLYSLPSYRLVREDRSDGRVIAATFEADKHLLTLRGKRVAVNLTDEQREERRERARAIRARQLSRKSDTVSSNG